MAPMRARKTVSTPTRRGTTVPTEPVHVLDVPFAARAVATAAGARWEPEHSVFVFRGATLPPSLTAFRAAPFSWEAQVQRELGGSTPAASTPSGPLSPRPHQQLAIDAITHAARAKRPGFLLADDVGLGKTLSTWEAVRALPKVQTVLIVCPLAVIPHWRRTIAAQGNHGDLRIVVMNYERLGKLFEVSAEAKKKVKSKKGLARAGSAPTFDVVIWDESHRCKNPTAARSKFAAKINARAGFVWLLWRPRTVPPKRTPSGLRTSAMFLTATALFPSGPRRQ